MLKVAVQEIDLNCEKWHSTSTKCRKKISFSILLCTHCNAVWWVEPLHYLSPLDTLQSLQRGDDVTEKTGGSKKPLWRFTNSMGFLSNFIPEKHCGFTVVSLQSACSSNTPEMMYITSKEERSHNMFLNLFLTVLVSRSTQPILLEV